jgi:predicted GIY-YIG superfamily endonuclease
MQNAKRFVYIIRSDRDSARHYVGITSDVTTRLARHNAGQNVHTARDRPWSLVVSMEFSTQLAAYRFERYLKSGSGRAFAKRHFSVSASGNSAERVDR